MPWDPFKREGFISIKQEMEKQEAQEALKSGGTSSTSADVAMEDEVKTLDRESDIQTKQKISGQVDEELLFDYTKGQADPRSAGVFVVFPDLETTVLDKLHIEKLRRLVEEALKNGNYTELERAVIHYSFEGKTLEEIAGLTASLTKPCKHGKVEYEAEEPYRRERIR